MKGSKFNVQEQFCHFNITAEGERPLGLPGIDRLLFK
jgi:hypothetical protein